MMKNLKVPFGSLARLKKFQILGETTLFLLFCGVVGCAHLSTKDERLLRNSALMNNDKAPEALTPKLSDEQIARQEADAHFTMAEAYSFQGDSTKAIEEFRQTLLKDPDSVAVRLRLAAEYVRAGLMSEAIETAKEAVQKAPKNAEAHMLLAGLYTSVKLYDGAVDEFQTTYELDPNNEEAALFIGAVYAEKGDFNKAENHFLRVLKVPGFKSKAKAYFYLGKVNHERENEDSKKTVDFLKKAVKLDPSYKEAVVALAQIQMEDGDSKGAEKSLLHFSDDQGPDPDVARILAKIYLDRKDYDKAVEQMEVLSKFDPQNISIKIQRALMHMQLKQNERAITLLEEILQDSPELDKARFYLGALYLDKGDLDKSIDNFKKIPPASTYYADSQVQVAQLYKQAGRTADAENLLEEAVKQRPDLPEFVAALAVAYDSEKKYDQARDVLEKALPKFPDNSQLRFYLGSVFDRLGKTQDSIASFKSVLEIDPDHVQALNYLAYTYAEIGQNLKEAEVMVKKALRLAPNDPYIMDTLGWVYYKNGDFKEAQKYIEKAYRQKPDEAVIVEHMGDLYVKTENWSRAAAMYQQAQILETDKKRASNIREKLAAVQNQAQPTDRLPASVPGR
jgi:putative PEP-CTERM system TPR-repeat lipoprotein